MSPVLLFILATIDGVFAGFRAAAGRNASIAKRSYYRRAMLLGGLTVQPGIALTGAVVLLLCLTSSTPEELYADFVAAGFAMIVVYAIYATSVLVAMGVWLLPNRELRGLATIIILGPGTLARPVVVIAGMVAAIDARPRWEVALVAGFGAIAVLANELVLNRIHTRRQRVWQFAPENR